MKCYTSGRIVSSYWEEAHLPYTHLCCGGNVYPGGECPLIAHLERCGRPNCCHVTFKVECVNPEEEQACTNSRTVPIGQLTGSRWQPPHHEVTLPLQGVQFPHAVEETCNQGVSTHWLPTKRGVVGRIATTWTFKVEWVNPAESRACRNSRTVPIGQLTGSSWHSPHHEVKVPTSRRTVSSLRELWIGGWSQQPRWRDRKLWVAPPQGPPPQLPHLWEEIPLDGNLPWRAVEERTQVREPYSARPERCYQK